MAALSPDAKPGVRVSLIVIHGTNELIACTLQQGRVDHQPLDLEFTEGEQIGFRTIGDSDVHLTGFHPIPDVTAMEEDDDEGDDGEDSEEENEEEDDNENEKEEEMVLKSGGSSFSLNEDDYMSEDAVSNDVASITQPSDVDVRDDETEEQLHDRNEGLRRVIKKEDALKVKQKNPSHNFTLNENDYTDEMFRFMRGDDPNDDEEEEDDGHDNEEKDDEQYDVYKDFYDLDDEESEEEMEDDDIEDGDDDEDDDEDDDDDEEDDSEDSEEEDFVIANAVEITSDEEAEINAGKKRAPVADSHQTKKAKLPALVAPAPSIRSEAPKQEKKQEAPAKPAEKKQEAPAKPAEKKQEAPAKPAEKKQEAPAKPAEKKQEVPAKPAEKKQDVPAKPAEKKQEAPAKPAEKKQDAPAKAAPKVEEKPVKHENMLLSGNVVAKDILIGSGKVAKRGTRACVYYVGILADKKKQFDACTSGKPFEFHLGAQEVIKGWDVGVVGMREGGKRTLTIPAEMAYGRRGAPPSIPPNAKLSFTIELKQVK